MYSIFSFPILVSHETFTSIKVETNFPAPKAAGLQRHRSIAEVQRKAGTKVEICSTAESPEFFKTLQLMLVN